jgi:hypothetical protein
MKLKYTIEWLDEYGQVYEYIDLLDYKNVIHYRGQAKHLHERIRIINRSTGKQTEHNYLDPILYAER